MQDDQISQSVDNLISQTPDEQSAAAPSGLSLGSNPSVTSATSSDPPPASSPDTTNDDTTAPTTAPVSDSSAIDSTSSQDDTNTPAIDNSTPTASTSPVATDSEDLTEIKQQALSQLSPIVGELDQPPEEKYRTLMMLIQASDDQTLIKSAYEAANKIDDKKAKAEALLNIVNEINYFTNQPQS